MAGVNATLAYAAAHLAPGAAGLQLADLDPNKVTPGLLGFVVFAAIGGALWLLLKSMNKHMNKVDFEVEPDARTAAGARVPQPAREPGPAADDTPDAPGAAGTTGAAGTKDA